MAGFVFKLETVLKQRKRVEQEKQRELAVREAKVVALKSELQQMDQSLKAAADELRKNHLTGSIDISFLVAHRRFLTAMQRQGLHVAQQIAAAQLQVDDARQKLADAAKKRKAIERLRERRFDQWRADQSRKELTGLDEIGTQIAYSNLNS